MMSDDYCCNDTPMYQDDEKGNMTPTVGMTPGIGDMMTPGSIYPTTPGQGGALFSPRMDGAHGMESPGYASPSPGYGGPTNAASPGYGVAGY